MWKRLIETDRDRTTLALRLILGAVVLPHGAQKLLGWFGGSGFGATVGYFADVVGIPAALGVLVILLESFGAIALLLGFLSRVVAAGIAAVMVGAALTVHWPFGFFMNWAGTQGGEGFEYHLLALAIAVAVMVKGSGAASLDRRIALDRNR